MFKEEKFAIQIKILLLLNLSLLNKFFIFIFKNTAAAAPPVIMWPPPPGYSFDHVAMKRSAPPEVMWPIGFDYVEKAEKKAAESKKKSDPQSMARKPKA
jgi:hypothetical protein